MSDQNVNDRKTNVSDFLGECGAGVLMEKLGYALSDAALAQVTNGARRKAKVKLEITMQQMGDHQQVIVNHKISTDLPTKRGNKAECDETESVFFVGRGGVLTATQPREENDGQFTLDGQAINTVTGEVKASNVRRLAAK